MPFSSSRRTAATDLELSMRQQLCRPSKPKSHKGGTAPVFGARVRRRLMTGLVLWMPLLVATTTVPGVRMVSALAATTKTPSPRTILITGATDGIGQHTAQKLAADGSVHLLVHGKRRGGVGADLVEDLRQRGALSATYFAANFNDLTEVEQLARDVKNHLSSSSDAAASLDVLINNAGIFDPPLPAKSVQGFDQTWAVNVMAPFVLTRRLLPLLAASHHDCPRIITTSSISQSYTLPSSMDELFGMGTFAERSKSGHTAYSHSKLGDYLFTVELAKRLQQSSSPPLARIKCLTMDPGTVNTKMLLAGWGPCGIPVKQADNTYRLATEYGAQQDSGTYHFGGSGSPDARNPEKLQLLFDTLEDCTNCSYRNLEQDLHDM